MKQMSLPVYVLEGDCLKDPNIQGVESEIRKLGCFHPIDWILDAALSSSWGLLRGLSSSAWCSFVVKRKTSHSD
jgi:hypothetical protein